MWAGAHSAWLLLDFLVALERRVQAACHGSAALPAPPPDAQAFFLAPRNMKVILPVSLPS